MLTVQHNSQPPKDLLLILISLFSKFCSKTRLLQLFLLLIIYYLLKHHTKNNKILITCEFETEKNMYLQTYTISFRCT